MENMVLESLSANTIKVISAVSGLEVTFVEAIDGSHDQTWGDVTGMIGLAGRNTNGNLMVSFEGATILNIVSRMFGERYSSINAEVSDAVGEIANMICGGIKKTLSEVGYVINMASPTVLVGKGLPVSQCRGGRAISLCFETTAGRFVTEMVLAAKIRD